MNTKQVFGTLGWSEYLSILKKNHPQIKYADQGMHLCLVMIDQQSEAHLLKIDEVTFDQGMEAIKQILIGFESNTISNVSFSVLAHNLKEELKQTGHLI